jgi:hypothetical protein
MGKICSFRANKSAEPTKFSPDDILGYRFIESKYFVSRKVKGVNVFLEYLVSGRLNVYYLRDLEGIHYFIDKAGLDLIELPYKETTDMINGRSYENTSTIHQDRLKFYLKDAKSLYPNIEAITRPERKPLIKLSKDYQALVCPTDSCIVYQKKFPKVRFALEAIGGLANFPSMGGNTYGLYGFLGYISLPLDNENLYVKTGVVFINDFFKIPIQLEYLFPKGDVRPKFNIGINLYNGGYPAGMLGTGLNIKLAKSVFWVLNTEFDVIGNSTFYPLPSAIFSFSGTSGIRINIK